MKKNRLIFYSVFGVLHLFIFIFSLYMDSNSENISLLLKLQGKIWMLKYCSLFLLIMFTTNLILHIRDNNRNKRLHDAQQREITELKAKLYDKGQQQKTPTPTA
jgi:uncharacterized membrane protein YhaH (DUF805 family)